MQVYQEDEEASAATSLAGEEQNKARKHSWREIDNQLEAAYQLLQHTSLGTRSLRDGHASVQKEYERVVSEVLVTPLSP